MVAFYNTMMSRMITDSGTPNSHKSRGIVTVSFELDELVWGAENGRSNSAACWIGCSG